MVKKTKQQRKWDNFSLTKPPTTFHWANIDINTIIILYYKKTISQSRGGKYLKQICLSYKLLIYKKDTRYSNKQKVFPIKLNMTIFGSDDIFYGHIPNSANVQI